MNIAQVRRAAPPAPSCFTHENWIAYLHTIQNHAKVNSRPFAAGVYRPEFSFCADCTLVHSVFMSRKGLCNPSALRVFLIKKEAVTHE